MTEKEFLELFNDIDDKFIGEERENIDSLYPAEIKYPTETGPALSRFSWGSFAAAAALFVAAAGGFFAAGHYFGGGIFPTGNTTTVPYQTVTDCTSPYDTSLPYDTALPETEAPPVTQESPSDNSGELPREQMPVLYETTLNCNGKSYTLTALLHRVRNDEFRDGVTELYKNYIWGDVALELSLDGEVKNTLWVYECCYGAGQVGGMPFDRENLGNDYFRVLNMEQDVLAYLTPNAKMGVEDENKGAILNAMLFTVNKEGMLVTVQRYATDEEKKELDTRPNGELAIYSGSYFKLTPDFDVEPERLTLHLKRSVENPWAKNGALFPAADIPVAFDFENYLIRCDDDYYKYLVYYFTDPWYPPLTLLDGSTALNSAILEYNHPAREDFDYYSVDFCLAVPFFAPAEDRTAGKEGAWFKLKKGVRISDYYVQKAVSDYYIKENSGYYPFSYHCRVDLYGDFNCTAAAEKLYNSLGEVSAIRITLDREYCDKLFGLKPCARAFEDGYANVFDKDFDDDRVCFMLTENMSNYYKVFNSLNDKASVKVSLAAKEFSLSYYFERGYSYDGMTLLGFDDDDFSLEILE